MCHACIMHYRMRVCAGWIPAPRHTPDKRKKTCLVRWHDASVSSSGIMGRAHTTPPTRRRKLPHLRAVGWPVFLSSRCQVLVKNMAAGRRAFYAYRREASKGEDLLVAVRPANRRRQRDLKMTEIAPYLTLISMAGHGEAEPMAAHATGVGVSHAA